jgi:uncharacterized protein (DUF952 family)
MPVIYHLARDADWRTAADCGEYAGGQQDREDGFIHFSTAAQVADSAARHRAGEPDILLVAVEAGVLGESLKWEAGRKGAPFPHLYGPLRMSAVLWAKPLPLGTDGRHAFPRLD